MMKYSIIIPLLFVSLFASIHESEYYANINDAVFGSPKHSPKTLSLKQEKGMLFSYYGYLPYWTDTLAYANFDYELLTHIAYFSVSVNADGSIGSVPNPARFDKIYLECRKRGVMVHMTFTLFGSTGVSALLNSRAARENAVSQIASFVEANGIEGANIDFEYVTSSVKDSFTLFIEELAESLHSSSSGRKDLYIAMPAVPAWYPGYDYSALSSASDGLFIMGYDFHYSGSTEAGPVAPTVNSSLWGYYAVNTTIGDYLDYGASREKMILGVPYYGYDWPTQTDALKSQTTGGGSAELFKNAKANSSSYGYEFDSNSRTPHYDYYTTQWHQCWYDDSASVYEKLVTASDSSLQGGGCWALGYDDGEDDMWNVVRSAFQRVPVEKHFLVRVFNPVLNVREGPSTEYDILNEASYGDEFVAFDYDGYWYKIYYPSLSFPYYAYLYGGDGTSVKYLEGDNSKPVVKVTASLLNVRSGPSTSYPILTQISEGQCFVAESLFGDWAKIILPDSNSRGWISYLSYTSYYSDISALNECMFEIDSIKHRDTLSAGDTCTLTLFLKNAGFVSADTLLRVKFLENSFFFDYVTWSDSMGAGTEGYDMLPGQNASRNILLRARSASSDTLVTERFILERNGDSASDTVELRIFIPCSGSGKEEERIEINLNEEREKRFFLYDVSGRMVYEKSGEFDKSQIPLKNGVYFLFLASGRSVTQKKIFLMR